MPSARATRATTRAAARPAAAKEAARGESRGWTRFFGLSAVALVMACTVPRLHQPPPDVESWLFFDGVCNLCDGFVNFVADHDAGRRVKFGAQQKHYDLLARIGAPTDLSTLVLVQGERFYLYSEAALRTMAVLDAPYGALAALMLVPRPLRDWGYKLVATHRYAVFGKAESCRVPSGDFRRRFIDYRAEDEAPSDPISGGLGA